MDITDNRPSITYVHSDSGHYGTHTYEYVKSQKPIGGPAKCIHSDYGYNIRAKVDKEGYVTPLTYTDINGLCECEIHGLLLAICESTSDVIITSNKLFFTIKKKWLSSWVDNGYKDSNGKLIKYDDLWIKVVDKLDNNLIVLYADELDVGIIHARLISRLMGHINTKISNTVEYTRKYWNNPIIRNPLLAYNTLCINSKKTTPGTYFVADTDNGVYDIGKRANYVGYSVVKLHKPDEYIDNIIKHVSNNSEGDVVIWSSMDRLYNQALTTDVNSYNDVLYRPVQHRHDYHFAGDGGIVIGEVSPIGLVVRGLHHFCELSRILTHCNTTNISELEPTGPMELVSVCITDLIRIGKKTTENMTVGTTHICLPHPTMLGENIILKLGKSLPNRNKISALCKQSANFYFINWLVSPTIRRYGVYITTEFGSAIYCNYYTDIIIGK